MQMSLAGGCVILAAILIRWMGRDRLPLGTFSALWALAALRLTVPVGLPFRFSAWALLPRRLPAPAAQFALTPAAGVPAASKVDITHLADPASPPAAANLSPWVILWAAGACALALALAICYIRTRRRFRDARPADNACTGAWLREHPCRRRIRICVSAGTDAPLTYGLFRPVILFPVDTDWSNRDQLNFVFVHELAHIRRFDAARKLVLAGVLCLHWFNPLVWVMALLAGRDMERACDRAVVTAFGPAARGDYARTLLDMEQRRGGVQLASGFAKNAIEERIHSIMKIRPRSFLSAALALALVLCVGAVFATAAPEDKADETDPTVLSGDVMQSQDGTTVYVFTAEGKPVSLTQEEYRLLLADPVEVEWWTEEEYAQWLEQEKEDLQDCLGQRAWTNADGWFTWTQEKIDQTIEMYEQVLEEIENGLLVSKAVDGRADVMLMQGDGYVRDYLYDNSEDGIVMYKYNDEDDGWIFSVMTQAEAGAMQEQNDAIAAERQQLEQQLAQLDEERAQIQQRLAAMGEAEAEDVQLEPESDGTVTVPPSETGTVFFEQADGGPYGEIESGSRVRLVDDIYAAAGNSVAVGIQTRTDASLTVSLHGDSTAMGQSVDLKAGQIQTVTFCPEQDDTFVIYLTNNSEYPVEFIASWAVS